MRLIDGDALMKILGITDMYCDKCAWCDKEWSRCKRGPDFEDACCAIENAPTIEERKRGFWYALEKGDKGYSAGDFKCSICGKPNHTWIAKPNFCPNCGADMRGETNE